MKSKSSVKEKKVISGLVQFPELPARLLSKEVEINPSTIGTITKRLKDNKTIGTSYVPNLRGLGFELVTIIQGTFRFPGMLEDEAIDLKNALLSALPSTVYGFTTADNWLLFSIHQNISQARNEYRILLDKLSPWVEKSTTSMIPISLMRAENYSLFHYHPIISDSYKLIQVQPPVQSPGKIELSDMEELYCHARVLEPDVSDDHIAKKLGASRNRVRRIRDAVRKKNALERRTTITLENIGYSGMSFYQIKLINKETSQIDDILKKQSALLPHFVFLAEDNTIVMLLATDKDTNQKMTTFINEIRDNAILVEVQGTSFQFSEVLAMRESDYHRLLLRGPPISTNIGGELNNVLRTRVGDIGEMILTQFLRGINKQIIELDDADVKRFCVTANSQLESLLGRDGARALIKDIIDNIINS
jgi:hypothetical protein